MQRSDVETGGILAKIMRAKETLGNAHQPDSLTKIDTLMTSTRPPADFRILLVYPNMSMLLIPPVAIAIFTALLRREGYTLDLFDVTPYVGEGSSVAAEKKSVGSVGDEMNTVRAERFKGEEKNESTHQGTQIDSMQVRPFSFENDLDIKTKTGLYPDFVRKVESFKPDLMITSGVEDTFMQTVKLMSLVEGLEIPSLHGGVFCTANPELAISYPGIDMIGVGEGEQIVLDVANKMRQGLSCEMVPGLWIKKTNGDVIRNERGPLYDFTKTTPDFTLFDDARFYRPMGGKFFKAVPLEAYRGCPYTCAYCNSPMQTTLSNAADIGNYVRRSPADLLRDHIAGVVEQVHPTLITFVDDSFMARPQRDIEAFCEMYEEFKIPFWFNTRPENMTPERIKMLKEVNCYRISFGLECGNEEFRIKKLLRTVKNKELIEKFEIIAAGGIPFSINNVIGFPEETRELIFETIELNKRVPNFDALTVSVFVPYHGTVLRQRAEELGYIDRTSIVSDIFHSTLNMPQLSIGEIDSLVKTFPLYVHFDKSVWRDIERAEHDTQEGRAVYQEFWDQYQQEAFSGDQYEKLKQTRKIQGSVGCTSNELDSVRIPIG